MGCPEFALKATSENEKYDEEDLLDDDEEGLSTDGVEEDGVEDDEEYGDKINDNDSIKDDTGDNKEK